MRLEDCIKEEKRDTNKLLKERFIERIKSFYNQRIVSLTSWAYTISSLISVGYVIINEDDKTKYNP